MAISDQSHLLEGGAEASHDQLAEHSNSLQPMTKRGDDPSQTIHSCPPERSVGISPPMMQSLQQSA